MSRVLYIQYTNPAGYPPLQHSSRILADAGWQVLFLGTGAAGAGALTFPPHKNITVRRVDFCKSGWRQKLHYLRFCLWVLWTALVWRPRWIYASDPLSCPVALLLTSISGLKVLYHEHDSPNASTSAAGFAGFVARSRRSLAQRADLCVLPNKQRLEWFAKEFGPLRNSACVWNCPGRYELTTAPKAPVGADVWLHYHGNLGPELLSPSVVEALALLPGFVKLRVVGYETVGARGYISLLRDKASALGIADRIEFLPPVSRGQLFAVTLRSDIGLAMMPIESLNRNFQAMIGASNKVFDYLACGLPVVVSDTPRWRETFVAPGYGVASDPADACRVAASIRNLIETPGIMRAMGESGRQRILSEWNYESMFHSVFLRMSGQSDSVPSTTRPPVETAARLLQK